MNKVAIGIDIGGTNTAIGLTNREGKVLIKQSIPTPKHGIIELYLDDIVKTMKALINKFTSSEVVGIGIGAPNGNYYDGSIDYAPNLSFKGKVPIVTLLKEKFQNIKKVHLTNDANAAALGEKIYGGAKDFNDFVMFTLGTGIGSGIVVNGNLLYGHSGFAGECGHMLIEPNGRLCGCGVRGHLEAYCSANGIKRTAFELLAQNNNTDSILSNYSLADLNSKIIYNAAKSGDLLAIEVFKLTGYWLGIGLANTIHHLDSQAIFLFGGPLAAGDFIIKPTVESMEKHLLPIYRNKVKIIPSQLNGGDAAILGASSLVWIENN
ncbi:ROK family protein [Lutibacter sp. TH_r2]|uniref:ROK family protein n=1 Tax=Lutibacter sp. TH_r2 TaxID=3082083 RepID=UPI00295538EE|nr:ROK family protein [Lutibacter sp. TH_r2]MDV7188462.1 ROK family protein [Lutibacter sp. TH_r2]